MIDSCSFGQLVVDGCTYTSDLIIYPDGRVLDGWWRERGHRLSLDDIARLVARRPDIIIAGTGVNGLMQPAPDLAENLERRGIRFLAAPNDQAAAAYNAHCTVRRTAAGFHLFC